MSLKNSEKKVELSRSNFDAAIAQFLYATGKLADDEEVKTIILETPSKRQKDEDLVPLKILIQKEVPSK